MKVRKVFDHVLDAGTYTELDYEYAQKFVAEKFDGWAGGCSAVARVTKDGTPLVGRNMDLYISHKPAYVFRTRVPGCHETVGLSYVHMTGPDYKSALRNGIPMEYYKAIPYLATDVLNDQGLYMETNMRCSEYYPTGKYKFRCPGTNPASPNRVCSLVLPRYIGEHCATVEEALDCLREMNIYTINTPELSWNFCFILCDASGHYGLVEIADNRIYWLDGQQAQTNFYITPELAVQQELKSGIGRYEVMMNGIDKVETEKDMLDLMDKVSYSQTYFPEKCHFDPKTEFVAARPHWTYSYVTDIANRREVMAMIRKEGERRAAMSRAQLEDDCSFWESTFTEIVNCKNKTLTVRFFEDENRILKLSFD